MINDDANYTAYINDNVSLRLIESSDGCQFLTLDVPSEIGRNVLTLEDARFLAESLTDFADKMERWEKSGGEIIHSKTAEVTR